MDEARQDVSARSSALIKVSLVKRLEMWLRQVSVLNVRIHAALLFRNYLLSQVIDSDVRVDILHLLYLLCSCRYRSGWVSIAWFFM